MAEQLLSDSDLWGGSAQPAAPAQPAVASPRLMSDQELWAAPADAKIPTNARIVDDPERGAGILTTARAFLAPNVDDQIKRFASARGISPNLYGVVNGDIVYLHQPSGQLVKEVPTMSNGDGIFDTIRRAGHQLAATAGPSVPQVAGAIAGGVSGPTPMSIPIAAGAAAATDVLRQLADRAMAGEDPTNIDYLNAAGQGAEAALGQGLGVGVAKVLTRNPLGVDASEKAIAKNPAQLAEWQRLSDEAKSRGIPLTAGELTDLSSLKIQERALRRFPETTNQMNDFIDTRNTVAVPNAVRSELDRLAPARPLDEVIGSNPQFAPRDAAGDVLPRQGLRGAAGDTIQAARNARLEASSPHYAEAYASGVDPDVRPVVQSIQTAMQRYPENHPARQALSEALDAVSERVPVRDPSGAVTGYAREPMRDYQFLHNAKEVFDTTLSKLRAAGADPASLEKATMEMAQVQRELTGILREAHPGYERGYQAYIQASGLVDELKNGGVGVLARKTGLERAQMLDAVLGANNITPEEVKRVRGWLNASGRADEWNSAVRSWLDNKLSAAMAENANGRPGNVPGKLYASIWGDERQRDVLKAALPDAGRIEGIDRLMGVLKAAARSLPEASPTATDQAAMARMAGGVGNAAKVLGKAASPSTLMNAGNEIVAAASELRAPGARRKLAEALMSQDALVDLRKLALLSPGSEKSLVAATNILTSAGLVNPSLSAAGLTRPADRAVPGGGISGWQ